MQIKKEEEAALPALRPDIQLNEAPPEPEGSPTWTLYDPAANKYYKIGWLEFECLSRFRECKTPSELAAKVVRETTLAPDVDTVKALVNFLIHNNLVTTAGEGIAQHFETQRAKADKPLWARVMHGYLFFTVPLFKPQRFLERTYPYVKFMLTRPFMTAVSALFLYGIFLSIQRVDEITATFLGYLNFEGALLLMATTICVKVIHELGHAYAATKYGVPVTTMGIAFIVLYPVLYTETTNAWKLRSRRDRINIAAAGIMAEIVLASVALLLWHVLPPGLPQSICFMVAIVSLAASLAINASPLMRFDGYYFFSDLVGVDNLQERSFAFGKWRLRKILWGWDDPPPEAVNQELQDFLCAFGYATWTYRFFLFLGIALLVNHIFFQPLGFVLMMVELGYFIFLPIFREVRFWVKRFRETMKISLRARVIMLAAALAVLSVFMPIDRSVEIPAVMHAKNYARFYPALPARIEEVLVAKGEKVEAGQKLFRLSSVELDYNIHIVSRRLRDLKDIRGSSQAVPELARKRVMIDSEIERTQKELEGFQKIREQLEVRAPFAGEMKDVNESLRPGQWVGKGMMLGLLADESGRTISGYVREQDIGRLNPGEGGIFYPEFTPFQKYPAIMKEVDSSASYEVFWPELSSLFGGAIPAEVDRERRIKPLPRHTIYAVRFELEPGAEAPPVPGFVARGEIRVAGARESLFNLLIKKTFYYLSIDGQG